MKTFIISFLILFSIVACAQQNPKPKSYPGVVKFTWDYDTTGTVSHYMIFYIQAADSNSFTNSNWNFQTGGKYEEVWDWWMASAVYNYCYIKIKTDVLPGTSYVRLGVIGVRFDGSFTDLYCIPKCIKVTPPAQIKNVKVE